MAARIYPFPTPLPRFLRKFSPPESNNFSLIFGGGILIGAFMVGLAWFVSYNGRPTPTSPTAADFKDYMKLISTNVSPLSLTTRSGGRSDYRATRLTHELVLRH
jgi:hypothetical protein